ncbi:MAG: hypothetical protein M1313_02255 [Nitrospirae bacterium]|nr:hypothetical protein [Nitrospirota bacterium]
MVSVTPALLTLSTTASKSYDGTPSLSLTASDTTFSGRVTGTLNSSGIGKDLDGTISLSIGDLTGENGFRASNYLLPTIFLGGAITSAGLPTHEPVYSLYYAPGTSVEGVFGEVVRRGIDWQPGNMQTIPIQSSGRDLSPFPGIGYILHIVGTGVNMEGLNEDVWVLLDGNQIGR